MNSRGALPNILLIIVDDMGVHQAGCFGNGFYETPGIDALARDGIRFSQAYATGPICSPSRARIYTGKHPARLHLAVDYEYRPGRRTEPESHGFDEVFYTRKPKKSADPKADPHHVDAITDRACSMIRNHDGPPFLCVVEHNAIHRPEMAPDVDIERFASKEGSERDSNRPVAVAMMAHLDRSIERLLGAGELGLRK